MSTSIGSDIHKATTWSIVLSVLMSATGILALFMPALTGVTVTIVFGWLLIFSGILHFGYAWQAARPGTAVWEALLGLVYGAVGFYTLVQPVAGLEALTLALVIYFIVEGVLVLPAAAAGKRMVAVRRHRHSLLRGDGWERVAGELHMGGRHARRDQHVLQRSDPPDGLVGREERHRVTEEQR